MIFMRPGCERPGGRRGPWPSVLAGALIGRIRPVLYTLIGSCRVRRINPEMYLKDLLTRLPDMRTSALKEYTPEAWGRRYPEARIQVPK